MSKNSTFTIKYSQAPSAIVIPEKFIKSKHIPSNQTLHLKFGSHRTPVQVKAKKTKHSVIALPAELAQRWSIPNGSRFRVAYRSEDQTLRLGPLIGVIVNRVYETAERRFGSNTTFYKELADTCQLRGGMAFFFSQDHIRTQKNTIKGWTYANGWRKMTFPLPDVVYNRISTRKIEQNSVVQNFFDQLNASRIPVFNEKFLDKNEVFDALQKDPTLHPYLPESYLLRNYAMFKRMCTKYPVIFLKPVKGSLGKGIIRITKLPTGKYSCQTMSINGAKVRHFSSISRIFKHLSGQIKSRRYQIQQGLTLLTCKGRPVDFRALVQKNNKGEWSITSIVGRIAGPNHFVSNLARGGSLNSVRDVLIQSKLPADQIKRVESKLKTLAVRLAEGIDHHIPYHFGELGVDLAVENNGKVWLLEINSKPSKSDNTSLATPTARKARPSVRKVIQYGAFLSQF